MAWDEAGSSAFPGTSEQALSSLVLLQVRYMAPSLPNLVDLQFGYNRLQRLGPHANDGGDGGRPSLPSIVLPRLERLNLASNELNDWEDLVKELSNLPRCVNPAAFCRSGLHLTDIGFFQSSRADSGREPLRESRTSPNRPGPLGYRDSFPWRPAFRASTSALAAGEAVSEGYPTISLGVHD